MVHGGSKWRKGILWKKLVKLFTVKGQWLTSQWLGLSAKESCKVLGLCLLCPTSRYYDCYWKTGSRTMCLWLSHYSANSGTLLGPHCKFRTRTLTNSPFCQHSYMGGVSVQRQSRQASAAAKLTSVSHNILKTNWVGRTCSLYLEFISVNSFMLDA